MSHASGPLGLLSKYRNEFGLLIAVAVVIAVTGWASPSYRQQPVENAQFVLRDASMLGIFAIGAAIVIISGGIDLSSGSVIAFSGTLFFGTIILLVPKTDRGQPITQDVEVWIIAVAALSSLLTALLIGTFHTWLITIIELPPFVATLATLVGLRSLARLLSAKMTGSEEITVTDAKLISIGSESWWIPVTIWVVLSVLTWVLMNRTIVGRHLYAMGGNEQAARLSGIRTENLKWLAYCISSLTAGISGILYASYVGSVAASNAGLGYELHAIASAVVGGCSLAGGLGTIPGVMLGALFLRLIVDAVQKLAVTNADRIEGLVVGILVVLAVAFNELRGTGGLGKKFFPGVLGWLIVGILTVLAGLITYVISSKQEVQTALYAAGATLLLIGLRAGMERFSSQRP